MANPSKEEKMAEAYRRGILPDDARAKYEEAMNRGLVADLRQDVEPQPEQSLLQKADREAAGSLATFGGTIPFAHEMGGATNSVISGLYNLPGLAASGDFKGYGGKVANAYDQQVQATRGSSRDFQERRPNTAAAVKGTGLGLQGVGAVKALPALVPVQTGNTAANVARTGAAASAEGGLAGMFYGFGDEQGGAFDERVARANEFGKWGAALGGPLGIALRHGPQAAQGLRERARNSASGQVLEMARESGSEVRRSSADAITGLLRRAGYARKDIDRGLREIGNGLQAGVDAVERPSLFAVELQKRFPSASQQIEDAFQQLATAPPKQGNTSQTLLKAVDDQQASQNSYLDDVFQERLGVTTIADEQAVLAAERGAIGEVRDRINKFAFTDARGKGIQKRMEAWLGDFIDDSEVMSGMRAAARDLGFSGKNEVQKAMDQNPAALFQKFGEISGATLRSPRGGSPVLAQARKETENLVDEISRYTREADSFAFARRAEGEVGPYKEQQKQFRESYSQEDAIADARGRFAAARDPVKADEFVNWYNTLPGGEQRLVQTVIRQDMEKMLRGGNIDDAGAYLTNLRKQGIHDVLVRVLGKDGEDISRAIQSVADEQPMLSQIDPRAGMQARVVRGRAADRARNHYTNNPLARAGDRIPPSGGFMMDAGFVAAGQVPYVTLARQALKVLRPRQSTREGIAEIFAMRPQPRPAGQRLNAQPVTPSAPPSGSAITGAPATQQASITNQQPAASRAPVAVLSQEEQTLRPAMQEQITNKRMNLLDDAEQNLPAQQQQQIIERRQNWTARNQPNQISLRERAGGAARAIGNVVDDAYYRVTGDEYYTLGERVNQGATLAIISSPIWGAAALFAHNNWKSMDDRQKREVAATAAQEVLQRVGPSVKPDLSENIAQAEARQRREQLEQQGILISEDGRLYFDRNTGSWQPIEQLDRN